jgi:hypothetical protein
MDNKISDNESYNNLREKMQGFDSFFHFYRFAKLFGFKDEKLEESFKQLPEFKNNLKQLSEAPDLFNSFYAEKGWIAHENMNAILMDECIRLAKENKIEEGEKKLIEYFESQDLQWLIASLKNIDAFKIRYSLLLKIYEDYKCERYYSCVPLLLMVIDGATDDIKKENKGFFAEGADLTAWDSIAGHESGLQFVAQIFNKSRKRTTNEKITLPYRNGILHGKDLGYDNVIVASKLWSTLFAIGAWAKIIKEGRHIAPEPKRKLSFKENLAELSKVLNEYQEWQIEKKVWELEFNGWKPRNFDSAIFDNLEKVENSPENELQLFFEHVFKRKYGLIAKQLDNFSRGKKTINQLAGEVREKFENIEVRKYEIQSIMDESPAITEIRANVTALTNGNENSKTIKFRMIYQDMEGSALVRGNKKGKWYLLDMCLWDFYNFEWLKE